MGTTSVAGVRELTKLRRNSGSLFLRSLPATMATPGSDGYEDGCFRVAAVERADGLPALLVGKFGDTACVDHNHVGGVAGAYTRNPFLGEHPCHRGGFGEVEFASECMEQGLEGPECGVVDHCADRVCL